MAMAAYEQEAAQVLEGEGGRRRRRRLEGDLVHRSDDGLLTHMMSTRITPKPDHHHAPVSLQHLTYGPFYLLSPPPPSYTCRLSFLMNYSSPGLSFLEVGAEGKRRRWWWWWRRAQGARGSMIASWKLGEEEREALLASHGVEWWRPSTQATHVLSLGFLGFSSSFQGSPLSAPMMWRWW